MKDGGWMNGREGGGAVVGVQQCVNEQHESESGPQLGQSWASRLLTGYN